MADEQRYCSKCGKTLSVKEFYQSNNREKYPEGYMNQCKKCMTMHVDNWDFNTFLWILQEVDVPWIPDEWNKLMMKYARDNAKLTGMTIIGRYLSKMKLNQYKDYKWKDSDFIQEMTHSKIEQAMKAQGFDAQEIAMAIQKNTYEMPDKPLEEPADVPMGTIGVFGPPPKDEEYDDLDLTDEDRTYLRLKWGKTYKPEEWVRLEQLYNEMIESYDVQSAGHVDTLKLLCKTSLKCNQLIDIGDVEGYQKMSKVYDSLMKSGKFTAVQNKTESGEFVDSVGELVMLCEKQGYIERYYVEDPKDKVDETLLDMKRYTSTLVNEETNLSNLIELAIKQNEKEDRDSTDEEEETTVDDDFDNAVKLIEEELRDEDFSEFSEFLDNGYEEDEELIKALAQEDEI